MSDVDRLMNRECKTKGCSVTGVLKSPAGMQTVYESGDAMNADQRCPECLDLISSTMLAIWRGIRDRQGTAINPVDTEQFRIAGKTVLGVDINALRLVANLGTTATSKV